MLLDKTMEIKWTKQNRKHFEDLGYQCLAENTIFTIKTHHLQPQSEKKIKVQCDECKRVFMSVYATYNKCKKDDLYFCKSCASSKNRRLRAEKEIADGTTLSFEAWAKQNNKYNLLKLWDYKLNELNPNQISHSSKERVYFKCPDNRHSSHQRSIYSLVVSGSDTVYCKECNSFAQYLIDEFGENGITEYWGCSNTISPWDIAHGSTSKVYLKCQKHEYHGEYEISPYNFSIGKRCSYCSNKKTHPLDSFAQFGINLFGDDFLDRYWDFEKNMNLGIDPYKIKPKANIFVHLKCDKTDYHGSYKVVLASFTAGTRCPYCHMLKIHPLDSIASKYPKSIELWSAKNKLTPYEYAPYGSKKVYLICENGVHEDYKRSLSDATIRQFRCPQCVRERKESFLQEKVRKYLSEDLKLTLSHEHECSIVPKNPKTKHSMPFDNEVCDFYLICEVNGRQHYEAGSFSNRWLEKNLTPEQQLHKRQLYDRYKKIVALSNGYHYIAIPYWTDDKDETWKTLIDTKIAEILSQSEAKTTEAS